MRKGGTNWQQEICTQREFDDVSIGVVTLIFGFRRPGCSGEILTPCTLD